MGPPVPRPGAGHRVVEAEAHEPPDADMLSPI